MNRIKISPLATASPSSQHTVQATAPPTNCFDKLAQRSDNQSSLFVPLHYEKNYSYPLIVWLHGDGETSNTIEQVMPQISVRNYVGIAPQAPVGRTDTGYYWEQQIDTIDMAHDSITAAIDDASSRFNISADRIFVGGSGAGGTMAFRIALERPDVFAGVISLNGPFPRQEKPLGQWAQCRNVPVFWAHDRRSKEFSEWELCEQLRLLHIAGFSVTLRQYPNGECLGTKALSDMDKWIMEMIDSSVSDPQ